MISNAVGQERISNVVGYNIKGADFSNRTPNLPQRVVILGEANAANQSGLSVDGLEVTSAQQAGEKFGFGSPIHSVMRILRPQSGDGIGGIPTIVFAQTEPGGAVAASFNIAATGTVTASGIHTVKVNGRDNLDGFRYDFTLTEGDSLTVVYAAISDALNAVLGSPVSGTSTATGATATAKWAGATGNDISIEIDTNDIDLGLSYTVTANAAGVGVPTVTSSLTKFENDWNTLVVNCYGTDTNVMDELEAFNGIPDPNTPTGRFSGIIMKPFVALTGSTLEDPSSITDTRLDNVTISIAPAPLSKGMHYEAAANVAMIEARIAQDTPHLDSAGRFYADMPTPNDGVIGAMSSYDNRDSIVKKGCSTVELSGGRYKIADLVTTFHPSGELTPQFRYVRNLMLDFNIRFGYYLLEEINVVNKVIASDDDNVNATGIIKPKIWTGIVKNYADDLASKALIVDADFMKDSVEVGLSSSNPDRLETKFKYKRSGVARISSTTAEAGFNFGA